MMNMNDKDKYIHELEDLLTQMMKPFKNVPFNLVIKGLSGYDVIPFDNENQQDLDLLNVLKKAAEHTTRSAFDKGIISNRPNEVGNYIEEFVINSLKQNGLHASRPKTKNGKHKATGYPDIFVIDKFKRPTYIEVKTYNIKNYQTTQRSFYLSPSSKKDDFKITMNARHLIFSFQIEKVKRNDKNIYVPVHWKIFGTKNLRGQIKHEFNATNKQMYTRGALLAEGSLKDQEIN